MSNRAISGLVSARNTIKEIRFPVKGSLFSDSHHSYSTGIPSTTSPSPSSNATEYVQATVQPTTTSTPQTQGGLTVMSGRGRTFLILYWFCGTCIDR